MPRVRRVAPSAAVLLSTLLLTATVAPTAARPGVAASQVSRTTQDTLDLATVLAADGTFRGLEGVRGSVDPAGWMLVSDVAAGEAPRFARATRQRRTRPRVGPAVVDGWSAVGGTPGTPALNGQVKALRSKTSRVYLGGDFYSIPGAGNADGLASWDGAYAAIGATNNILDNTVNAIAIDGSDLYVGGTFQNAAGIATADRVAKWEGSTSTWETMGGALDGQVRAIAVSGPNVYVGGDFTEAGGLAKADYIARWDGAWHAMGENPAGTDGALSDHVSAIAVDGAKVYVGGLFSNAAGIAQADHIARWDGTDWHAMGASTNGNNGALGAEVFALLVSGPSLYVGGYFQNAAGIGAADYLARWRSNAWSSIGSTAALTQRVYALAKAGEDLYVGGHFLDADGIAEADRVVRWDGSAWHALGSDGAGDGALPDTVLALAVFDGELYAGGVFEDAAGITEADYLARWELPVGYRSDGRVRAGTSGTYKGDGVYNTSGRNQKLKQTSGGGTRATFQISLQNDSATSADTFSVEASGPRNGDFEVTYLQGSTDISTAVRNGTYDSLSAGPGSDRTIKVRIRIKGSASAGEELTRTIRITSTGDPTKVDVVQVTARRG